MVGSWGRRVRLAASFSHAAAFAPAHLIPASSLWRPPGIQGTRAIRWAAASPKAPGAEDYPNACTAYENAINDLESQKLYRQTPQLMTVQSLSFLLTEGRLDLAPDFQRGFVWKTPKQSRLIATALCNRLMPGVVLDEEKKGQFNVVDGVQRISTMLAFYLAGKEPEMYAQLVRDKKLPDFRQLKFSDTEEDYTSWNGLTFAHLSLPRQQAFDSYGLHVSIVPYNTPRDDVFSCYEDINSGGLDLSSMQVWKAAYRGPYIQLLEKLKQNKDLQTMQDPQKARDHTFKTCEKSSDCEMILRGFAFRRSVLSFERPMKKFLNKEMDWFVKSDAKVGDKYLEEIEKSFARVMKVWRQTWDDDTRGAFRIRKQLPSASGGWGFDKNIDPRAYAVFYVALDELLVEFPSDAVWTRGKAALQEATEQLFEVGGHTWESPRTAGGFQCLKEAIKAALRVVLAREDPGPRRFSDTEELKRNLYEQQAGKCSICAEGLDLARFMEGTYAEVDHVIPHSKGGRSDAGNAGLAHVACNRAKGAKTPSSER